MNTSLTFRRVRDSSDPMWRPVIDLYTRVFEEGQRETERAILHNLVTSEHPREGGHVVIAALGSQGACVGANIFSYLPAIACGYVSYLFVRPESRRRGIGQALLEDMRRRLVSEAARAGHGQVRGVFAEIQRHDGGDSVGRNRFHFWESVGVLPLAVEWHYPPLHRGEPPAPMHLAFGSYPGKRVVWYPRELENVARAIFDATYSYLPASANTLITIIETLRRLPQDVPVPYIRPWTTTPERQKLRARAAR